MNDNNDDPAEKGLWEPIQHSFQHLPIHIALLHTGKVLAFGGSGNDETHLNNPYPAEIFEPHYYEDIRDDGSHLRNNNNLNNNNSVYEISNTGIAGDIFCCGHAFLPDGRLIVAGGTYKYDGSALRIPIPPFSGLDHSYIFDPVDLKWSRLSNMRNGRWYPTCIMLSDGRILAMAGLSKYFPWVFLDELEIYSDNDRSWKKIPGANHWIPMYPRLHLIPSGEIFYAGSYNTHYTFPFSLRGFPSATFNIGTRTWTKIGNPNNVNREEGTTVLLPLNPPDYTARVLLIAGGLQPGTEAIKDVEKIDFSEKLPRYKTVKPLKHARYYAYSVLLPDQSVLVLGGKTGTKGHMTMNSNHMRKKMTTASHSKTKSMDANMEVPHDPHAVLEPELFDPKDETWHPMASMKVDRLYHAGALLLPDGRVMSAGSNPERRMNELRIEIFRPPYLFRSSRPVISKYPSSISYGKEFEVKTDDANHISAVVLIRPSVTTHCVNTEQRYIGLEYRQKNSNTLLVNVPSNRNVLPPGYYMLFAISGDGVPSIAPFVLVV